MKKRILALFTALTVLASLFTVVPASAETPYKALDLSLTQTSFTELNAQGKINAYLIAEESVTMPVLTVNTNSAVELDTDGSYKTTEGTVEKRPQRKTIENGTVEYFTADKSVIDLKEDGSFTTVGYGVATVKVAYDNNTNDTSDDLTASVMITVSDESRIEIYGGTWSTTSGYTLLKKVDGTTANGVNGRSSMYAKYQPDWDPMGTTNDPLVFKSINNSGEGEATAAVNADDTAVFSGWFYDNMLSASQKFLSFGYAGTTEAASVTADGNSSMMIMAQDASEYKLMGGVYSSSMEHTSRDYEKLSTTGTSADSAMAGVSNAAKRSVGWHQFVVTAESSIVNPGTDYMLIKAYLDGELITSQDIYVGNVEIGKRRFNIFAGPRTNTTQTVWYKDLSIRTFKRSGVIAETIPTDGAVNVPLYQKIKVKLTSACASAPAVSVTSGGSPVASSASLDDTKTILTIDIGKLTAGATYTVTVGNDEDFTFTAGSDSEMATMLESMTDYKIKDARYVDFADKDKSAEEYGVGFVHNNLGTDGNISTVSDVKQGYLTMTENARAAMSSGVKNNPKNGIVIRSVSPRNGDADRVVVSYKFKPESLANETDTLATSGGIGRPFMAVDDATDSYNNLKTVMISGGQYTQTNNLPVLVADTNAGTAGYKKVRNYMLMGNATTTGKGVAESGKEASNGDLLIPASDNLSTVSGYTLTPDTDGYYRLTYVVDVDKNGVNYPTWTAIFGNDLDDENSIFKLKQEPTDKTAYTSVDSIFIPMSKGAAAITDPIVLDIKDIEIYQLTKTIQAEIDDQPVVKESETDTEVLAGNIAGKTVDVSINAQGDGDDYTVVVAAIADGNKLLNAKTANGKLGSSKNIGVENFEIPKASNGEAVKLYVFVWNSFENARPLFTKIEYTKAE